MANQTEESNHPNARVRCGRIEETTFPESIMAKQPKLNMDVRQEAKDVMCSSVSEPFNGYQSQED